MQELAASIADRVDFGTCIAEPLPWDPDVQVSECDLMVEYIGESTCPFPLEPGKEPVLETLEEHVDGLDTALMCPLPRIPAPLPCQESLSSGLYLATEPGWYYCEEQREDFREACNESGEFAGHDEDGDGLADCDDPQCQMCEVCGGDGIGCASRCRHAMFATQGAGPYLRGRMVRLYCYPPQWENDPPSCQ
jgi:hypothetical protein